ncbi:contractile injection system tape measure protein [Massilia glaciei]|uniref:Uncharacterized protein n=1 Tax=Massilia glaciei TaxID=1524097 RepID=A0A2U2HH61_9BURK|nr:hypothetical protein C7C56_018465 [Massilia glaciei]
MAPFKDGFVALATDHNAALPLRINNADLSLLHSFFDPLFTRLEYMDKGRFRDERAQRRAA